MTTSPKTPSAHPRLPILLLPESSLTISVYVDPVKDSVGELLRGGFLVVVAVDGADCL